MDSKEKQLIDYYYNKFINRCFNEKDVYSFLIILRQYAKKESPVYEFANFIAHREKDRGYIRDYLETTKYKINNIGKIDTTIIIREVFSDIEISNSFNETLRKVNKDPMPLEIINDIIMCIISLLQDVRIVSRKNKPIGKLKIGLSKTKIFLIGEVDLIYGKESKAIFPVLEVNNLYLDIPEKYTEENPAILSSTVEVISESDNIQLRLLSDYKIL